MLLSIVAVVFTFSLVVFLHECGHFIACRIAGMKVLAFSSGFGPEIYGKEHKGTRYSIRWIPLGGYVQPAGEIAEEAKGEPDEYFSKPWYSRLGVCLAGPLMNYILAFILFSAVIIATGKPIPTNTPKIGDLSDGYPAALAGMQAGDTITSINGKKISKWEELTKIIHANPEKEIKISYQRDGKITTVKLKPQKTILGGKELGLIGIAPEVKYEPVPFLSGIASGAYQCWYFTALTVTTLKDNIVRGEKPDLAGPVGIITVVSKAAHRGFSDFFYLVALLSVAIGFFNLLPIPLVDGGQAILFIAEGITRRKPSVKIVSSLNTIGLTILVGIFVFATYSDVVRIKKTNESKKAIANAETVSSSATNSEQKTQIQEKK